MTEKLSCSTCGAWAGNREGGSTKGGQCRRHAPTLNKQFSADGRAALWPVTVATDWCYEYIDERTIQHSR